MKKTLETARLELGDYFGNGANFNDWEKEFGVFNTSIIRTEEETIAYYKEVEDVIEAVFETLSWSERTDSIVRLINNYVYYNGYDTEEVKNHFSFYNHHISYKLTGEESFPCETIDDSFLDDLYNELLDTVVQDRYDLLEYQVEQIEEETFVKDEEFNKILNSLPLDKILMNKIIKALF